MSAHYYLRQVLTSTLATTILATSIAPTTLYAQNALGMKTQTASVLQPGLAQVYAQNNDYAFWYGNRSNEMRLQQLIQFLPLIEAHGLKVNDYQFQMLLSLKDTQPEVFEIEMTTEVLRLLKDVSVGRVNPRSVSNDVKFSQRVFQVDGRVAEFFRNPSLESFNLVAPQHSIYKDLQNILAILNDVNRRGGFQGVRPIQNTVRVGDSHPSISEMKNILNLFGHNLDNSPVFDQAFLQALQEVQVSNLTAPTNSLKPNDSDLWEYFSVSSSRRAQQVELMLEKLRWLPENLGQRYLFVNLANQELTIFDKNLEETSPIKAQKAINGRIDRKTPTMADQISHVILNPTWTVPPGIFAKDKFPKLQSLFRSGGPAAIQSYLASQNFNLVDKVSNQPLDPFTLDWASMTASTAPYKLVQSSGDDNALGVVKFRLAHNKDNIYLHDTNERGLFGLFKRMRSSGCIRVQHPVELAAYLLQGSQWSLDKIEQEVSLAYTGKGKEKWVIPSAEMKLPVYIMPVTAYVKNGRAQFTQDLYKQNLALLNALKKAGYYQPQSSNSFSSQSPEATFN